jgi:hypothetical protein
MNRGSEKSYVPRDFMVEQCVASLFASGCLVPGTLCFLGGRGMRHTSTALNFYGASKASLHKPRSILEIDYLR